jgi:hypothetical protein
MFVKCAACSCVQGAQEAGERPGSYAQSGHWLLLF